MGRWFMRVLILSGFRAAIDWWVQRQERKADELGPEAHRERQAARQNGKRLRQSMRLLRRFLRF